MVVQNFRDSTEFVHAEARCREALGQGKKLGFKLESKGGGATRTTSLKGKVCKQVAMLTTS